MEKKVKSFDGTNIHYSITRKSKRFLVFIHGLGGNLVVWRKQRAFFHGKNISTLAIDLRGHGYSDKPDSFESYSFENLAKDISFIIKKERIKNFVIVSHCFGGPVALTFSKLFPKLPKAYVLMNTTYKSPPELKTILSNKYIKKFMNIILLSYYKGKKSHLDDNIFAKTWDWSIFRINSDIQKTSLKSYVYLLESFSQFNAAKSVRTIKKPMLIIHGGDDSVINKRFAIELNKLVKNSKLNIVPNGNHIMVISNPKILEKDTYDFLKSIKFI